MLENVHIFGCYLANTRMGQFLESHFVGIRMYLFSKKQVIYFDVVIVQVSIYAKNL